MNPEQKSPTSNLKKIIKKRRKKSSQRKGNKNRSSSSDSEDISSSVEPKLEGNIPKSLAIPGKYLNICFKYYTLLIIILQSLNTLIPKYTDLLKPMFGRFWPYSKVSVYIIYFVTIFKIIRPTVYHAL